jgi:hypothetical protein
LKKLILICGVYFFYSLPALSQSHSECQRIELQIINEEDRQKKICERPPFSALKPDAVMKAIQDENKCMLRSTIKNYEMSCNRALKASRRIQILLWEEEIKNTDKFERQIITDDEFLDTTKKIMGMIREESENGYRLGLAEFQSRDAEIAANRRYETAIRVLGGISQRNTEKSDRQYLLNGRFITCREQGSLTICN